MYEDLGAIALSSHSRFTPQDMSVILLVAIDFDRISL
jgi:hypothetical protein